MMPWDVLLGVGLVVFVWAAMKRAVTWRRPRRLRDHERIGLLAGPTRKIALRHCGRTSGPCVHDPDKCDYGD